MDYDVTMDASVLLKGPIHNHSFFLQPPAVFGLSTLFVEIAIVLKGDIEG